MRSGVVTPLARYLRRSVASSCTTGLASGPVPEIAGRGGSGEHLLTAGRSAERSAADRADRTDGSAAAALPLIRADPSATVLWTDVGDDGALIAAEAQGNSMEDGSAGYGEAAERLRHRREMYALQGVACLGEYLECVAPLMQARLVDPRIAELSRTHAMAVSEASIAMSHPLRVVASAECSRVRGCSNGMCNQSFTPPPDACFVQEMVVEVTITLLSRWRADNVRLAELLRVVCALLAHRRFAEAFIAGDGLPLLLALPLNPHTAGAQLECIENALEKTVREVGDAQKSVGAVSAEHLTVIPGGCIRWGI